MTNKTARFLATITANEGITAAELHRRIGGDYAHGHHKFSYETVSRMISNGLVERCSAADGLRGTGLRVKRAPMVIRYAHSSGAISVVSY